VRFTETALPGACIVEPQCHRDDRGFFARTWCCQEFEAQGLNAKMEQCSISYNRRAATLRGMHYQAAPYAETKLVRCTAGAIYDVILDLRPDSPAYLRWAAVELTADNRRALYIPEGLAHGFFTLADDTEVFYQITTPHQADAARGVRWNDSAFGIAWPGEPCFVSEKDSSYPDYEVQAQ
jgi:dTDP-4-dehydrorhamnose 3,5-epimerase